MAKHDGYDDGLVHGHGWATEPARPRPGHGDDHHHLRATGTPPASKAETYDEGLVHDHAWASAERGRPAVLVLPAE